MGKQKKGRDTDNAFSNFFKLATGKAKGKEPVTSEKLQSLLQGSSKDQGDKLKISFAEGFLTGQTDKTVDTGSKSAWSRFFGSGSSKDPTGILLKYLTYGLLFFLAFRFLSKHVKESSRKLHQKRCWSLDDVRANEEAKDELMEVVDFLKDPNKYIRLGGRLPKGVLLVGPPGTGKTLLARAVAGEAGVPFFHVSGSQFDEMLVGQGAKRVRDLFAAAKERAPSVIFIDEIDSVGMKRTNSAIHPFANQTINQLLNEMDGFLQNEGVIVLGATNRKNDLDKALLRPGRFDVEVHVRPPEVVGRLDIFNYYLGKVTVDGNVEPEKLAKMTTGFTGADIENMVNLAAVRAAADGHATVPMQYFETARDKVLMGPERKRRIPDEHTNKNTAYHEAGHALVSYYTKNSQMLHKVTIVPRGAALGLTQFMAPESYEYGQTKAQLQANMDVAMGGRAAEELIFGHDEVTTGVSNDLEQATHLAEWMVKHLGMSEKAGLRTHNSQGGDALVVVNELGQTTSNVIDSEIQRLLNESYERARSILVKHSAEHKRLAEALLKYETLDADEMKTVIEGRAVSRQPTTPPATTPGGSILAPTPLLPTAKPVVVPVVPNITKDDVL